MPWQASQNGKQIGADESLTIESGDIFAVPYTVQTGERRGGGAIYNEGAVTTGNASATGVKFQGNNASSYNGGAIYNTFFRNDYTGKNKPGTITLTNATFENNHVSDYGRGGAIYNDGFVSLTNATFSRNNAPAGGGAIYNDSWGTITLNNATFSGNTTPGYSGAIYNNWVITLNNVTLQTETDTIYNHGTLSLTGQLIFGMDVGTQTMLRSDNELNFDISATAPDVSPFIADWSRVDNTGGVLSITVSSTQRAGEYHLLVSGIASFESDVFVIVKELDPARGYKVSAEDFIYGGKRYSLAKPSEENRDLKLIISEDSSADTMSLWETVKNGESKEISGKVFRNLFARGAGGAICNKGSISGSRVLFTGNTAKGYTGKEDIYDNYDPTTLNNGGAIYNEAKYNYITGQYEGGTITLTDAGFSGNTAADGGAIDNGGTITLNNATFSRNNASGLGGAILNSGTITLNNATFTNNSATRPIDNLSYFISSGGAIYNGYNGTIMLTNATFNGNTAIQFGGAIDNNGTITLNNVTLKTASDTIYNSTGGTIIVAGRLSFDPATTTAMLTNAAAIGPNPGGKLIFDLSAMDSHTPNGTALISNWARVDNQGTISITISGNQANGNYRLADNAANFNFNVTVNTNTTSPLELGTFTAGTGSFDFGNKTYHLVKDNSGTLIFSITDWGVTPEFIPPAAPEASADITILTNQDVTVTAVFSADSVTKEYSLDNETWLAYTAPVVMTGNGTVFFRATDEFWNISTITAYEVTNIDKTPPAAPEFSLEGAIELSGGTASIRIAATFSDDSVKKEYSFDHQVWQDYTGSITANTGNTIYFRGTDEAGNTSVTTCAGNFQDFSGDITLAISSAQPDGDYVIANQAGAFTGKLAFILDGMNTKLDFVLKDGQVVSAPVNVNGKLYTLSADDKLTLKIGAAPGGSGMTSTTGKLEWNVPASTEKPVVCFSLDNFDTAIAIQTGGDALDLQNQPAGEYQWRIGEGNSALYANGENNAKTASNGGYFTSNANGIPDVFFAAKSGVWSNAFHARNNQTGETASITGKNRFQDVFSGSVSDANILYLTDDANGDALFQDDMYSACAGSVRLDNIREIRAGAGDDVVDFTSNWLASGFSGTILRGGDGDDVLWADGTDAKLFGDAGNDILRGGKGNDLIAGGAGDDNLSGGGGNDIFAFGADWGNDTVAWNPDDGGSLTLVFEDGITLDTWDASATSLTSGGNTITFDGFTASDVTIQIGADEYAKLSACGAFLGSTTQKVYEDTENPSGILASL